MSIIGILAIAGIIFFYAVIANEDRYERFYNNVKVGDRIMFYVGEEKYYGTLKTPLTAKELWATDEIGEYHKVYINTIHPLRGVKYCKDV